MQGDILFQRGAGSFFDRLILARTGPGFVHCEIAVGPGESIGALSDGVELHAVPSGLVAARTGARMNPTRRAAALAWLRAQVGDGYGWADIAQDALGADLPLPSALTSGTYCCSHLACAFLLRAGYPLPAALAAHPELVTPNSLAHALGIS